jgi:hypothetical protein
VESGIRADHFTIESLRRRLESLSADPWAELTETLQRISSGALKRYKL